MSEVLWRVFEVYAVVSFTILMVVAYRMWLGHSVPSWVLTNDGKPDWMLARINLWPYFYAVMLIQYVRVRKARAVTVRRVDQ